MEHAVHTQVLNDGPVQTPWRVSGLQMITDMVAVLKMYFMNVVCNKKVGNKSSSMSITQVGCLKATKPADT